MLSVFGGYSVPGSYDNDEEVGPPFALPIYHEIPMPDNLMRSGIMNEPVYSWVMVYVGESRLSTNNSHCSTFVGRAGCVIQLK